MTTATTTTSIAIGLLQVAANSRKETQAREIERQTEVSMFRAYLLEPGPGPHMFGPKQSVVRISCVHWPIPKVIPLLELLFRAIKFIILKLKLNLW